MPATATTREAGDANVWQLLPLLPLDKPSGQGKPKRGEARRAETAVPSATAQAPRNRRRPRPRQPTTMTNRSQSYLVAAAALSQTNPTFNWSDVPRSPQQAVRIPHSNFRVYLQRAIQDTFASVHSESVSQSPGIAPRCRFACRAALASLASDIMIR